MTNVANYWERLAVERGVRVSELTAEVETLKAKLVEANSMEGRSCWVDGCENLAQRCDAHSFGEGAENAARYAIEIMRLTERATAAEAENATLREKLDGAKG